MARYDPSVFVQVAERLYTTAQLTVAFYVIALAALGAPLAFFFGRDQVSLAVGAILGGLLGYVVGSEKALQIRFQAQVGLALVELVELTRAGAAASHHTAQVISTARDTARLG